MVYEDEASFRQTPTLYRTWARRGQQPQIPTRGERHTQKILGAVSVPTGDFVWRHQSEYFNAETYLSFVDEELLPHYYRRGHRVYLIQDNASFHKKPEVLKFFTKHRRHIEVFSLPPYSPDFNATERLWHYTRKEIAARRYKLNGLWILVVAAFLAVFQDVMGMVSSPLISDGHDNVMAYSAWLQYLPWVIMALVLCGWCVLAFSHKQAAKPA
jgi:transposase